MRAHRVKTTVLEGGSVALKDLPFQAGEPVEVILLAPEQVPSEGNRYPLRNQVPYRYDDPFSPAVAPEDWEANR